jgi:general secretion pathway protein C
MEAYVKRYFWLVNVMAVVVCTVFVAKGVNHLVEARYLGDSDKPPPPRLRQSAFDDGMVGGPVVRSKYGAPLAERNMFCSQCKPASPASQTGPIDPVLGGGVPITSLSLRLVATNVSTVERYSFATIENTSSAKEGYYAIGDRIPDAGEVKKIRARFVDFENKTSKRLERIVLLAGADVPAPPLADANANVPPQPAYMQPTGGDEITAMIEAGVKQQSETAYSVDRGLVDKILENPAVVATGARIVPAIRNGKPNGYKLYAIRPGSIYAKIGLQNGDTIQSINGFELTTADKALEVYTKVREANNLTVQAERRGKQITMTYSIR